MWALTPWRARPELLTQTEFQDLYRAHARPLWAYVFRLTGNAADADDLLQGAYCRLLATPLATHAATAEYHEPLVSCPNGS